MIYKITRNNFDQNQNQNHNNEPHLITIDCLSHAGIDSKKENGSGYLEEVKYVTVK